MSIPCNRERREIVLATGNPGKARELNALLAGRNWSVVPQSALGTPEAAETGLTFVENALLKARNAARHTGRAAIADDSGLETAALGGAPGVHSARYAGAECDDDANNRKLLAALRGLPETRRAARFCCCIVFLAHAADPDPLIAQGRWEGRILAAPRGSGGFGYDPLFFIPALNRSAAELTTAEKSRFSHRGQALRALLRMLDATPHCARPEAGGEESTRRLPDR